MKSSSNIVAVVLGIASIIAVGHRASAVVNVGDAPRLDFQSADGGQISLDKLKGKIVIVDFWATWCGPCMGEAGHMVAVNAKYAPQGLQFIGISLDQDKSAMQAVAKEKGFVWPQYFDGLVWKNKLAVLWGVNSIPRTFLIGPDGKVLWTGHPAAIDPELERAFKEHPPVLVDPKILATAKANLSAAKASLDAGDTKGALAAMAKIPVEAKADKDFVNEADNVRKDLEAAGEKMLAEIDPLIEAKDYGQAVTRLKQLSSGLIGLPAGAQAQKKLTELQSKPEVKSAMAKAARAETAQNLFDAAQKLKDAKNDDQAYPKFKLVAAQYGDTPAGAQAADIVKVYEKDPQFVKRANESAAAVKAASTFKLAESYIAGGRNDLARNKYQEIIDQFPGTSFAEKAKKAIAALPSE